MAIEHARLCSGCERECPSWADRCPACGSTAIVHRIVMIPPQPAELAVPKQRPPRRTVTARRKAVAARTAGATAAGQRSANTVQG
jgi:Predicted nucleic acid-binding protein, consists of a PIN domain and a Zn-ribbon module